MYGVGSAMLFFPTVSVAPEYFDRRRGAAMGLVLSCGSIGGLVFSLVERQLLDVVGIRWTLRIMALESVMISLPIMFLARPSRSLGKRPNMVSIKLAKKPAFTLQAVAAMLQSAGNFVPMTFTPEFSTVLGFTAGFGAVLLSINNGVNAFSRLVTGALADTFGRQNVLIISTVASALSVLILWMGALTIEGQTMWVAFVVFYGAMAGGYNALFPVTVSEVFGIQNYASVNSFLYFVRGIGAAFGSPVGGHILGDSRNNLGGSDSSQAIDDYRKLVWYDGALLLVTSVCVIGVRGFDAVEKKQWRWKA